MISFVDLGRLASTWTYFSGTSALCFDSLATIKSVSEQALRDCAHVAAGNSLIQKYAVDSLNYLYSKTDIKKMSMNARYLMLVALISTTALTTYLSIDDIFSSFRFSWTCYKQSTDVVKEKGQYDLSDYIQGAANASYSFSLLSSGLMKLSSSFKITTLADNLLKKTQQLKPC